MDKSGRDWNRHLPHMLIAYQVSPQESTQEYPFSFCMGEMHTLHRSHPDYKTELVGSLSQACVHKSRKPSRSRRSIMTDMQKSPSFIKEIVYLCTSPLRRKRRGRYTSIPIHFMALPCTIYSSGVYDLYMLGCNLMYSQWLNPDLKCTKGTYNLYTHRNLLVYIFAKSRLAWNLTFTPG